MEMLISQQKAESIVEIIKMGGGPPHRDRNITPNSKKKYKPKEAQKSSMTCPRPSSRTLLKIKSEILFRSSVGGEGCLCERRENINQ